MGTKGEDSLGERREQMPGTTHWYDHRDVNWGTGIGDHCIEHLHKTIQKQQCSLKSVFILHYRKARAVGRHNKIK